MATRFGGASPSRAYATQLKWLVGCSLALIALLVVALVMVAQNAAEAGKNNEATAVPAAAAPAEVPNGAIEVLVAAQRIEQGQRLTETMFAGVNMEEPKVPFAAIRRRDLPMIVGKYASRMITPNVPIVMDDVTTTAPLSALNIPAGFRAVTITVDARSGVEGFAKPDTRVDVNWTFTQDGKQKVATLVRFAKVLSVAGNPGAEGTRAQVPTQQNQVTTVTLLASERDAKRIELARTLGTLSLSLVGDQDQAPREEDPDPIDITDLVGAPAFDQSKQDEDVGSDGVLYTVEEGTGRQIRYILKNGRWVRDKNFG